MVNDKLCWLQDGIAQQWFDELDNLAFSQVEDETSSVDEGEHVERHFQDDRVHFDCSISISPGTAEVSTILIINSLSTLFSQQNKLHPFRTLIKKYGIFS